MNRSIVYAAVLFVLFGTLSVAGQTQVPDKKAEPAPADARVGGPAVFFRVYDGTSLRKGDYSFSEAYSNYDMDEAENLLPSCRSASFSFENSEFAETFKPPVWPLDRKFELAKTKQGPICIHRK